VLRARDVQIPDAARVRITSCADLDRLDTWLRRSATASSTDELFAGD
jgi:hypothetical protein